MWRQISALPARIQSTTFEQLIRPKCQSEPRSRFGPRECLKQDVFQAHVYRIQPSSFAFTTQTISHISAEHENTKSAETNIKHLYRWESYAVAKRKRLTDIFTDWFLARFKSSRGRDTKAENEFLQAYLKRDPECQLKTDVVDITSAAPQILVFHIIKIAELELLDSHLNGSLLQVYTDEACLLLARDGNSIQEVTTWAWILTSQDADEAIEKLILLTTARRSTVIPFFLLQFILSRRTISPQNLKFLADRIKASLISPSNCVARELDDISLRFRIDSQNPTSMMLLFIRLVRHCRNVWFQGLRDVADILTLMFPTKSLQLGWESNVDQEKLQRLTFYYNRALVLISRPSNQTPFQNVTLQHRASLRILKSMTQFKPHISVTREGFRALLSVQLAQKKAKLEQEWADLKSLAWPPWKEDKSGIDADRGDIGSESRALRVIRQMVEAGYTKKELEQIATVYTGWDTDNSPTIQTRKFLPMDVNRLRGYNEDDVMYTNDLWAARIASTRTLREAWSAFLSFEKEVSSHQLKPYTEMLMKIMSPTYQNIRAGDGREVLPEPLSPRYITYVPSSPPTLDQLLERMKRKGLRPLGKFLSHLIYTAESFQQALKYLAKAHPMLVHDPQQKPRIITDEDFLSCIQSLPPTVITAYLHVISRFPHEFLRHVRNSFEIGPYLPLRFLQSLQDLPDSARLSRRIVIHYLLFILANYKLPSTSMWHASLVAYTNIFLYGLRGGDSAKPLAADAWSYLDLVQRSVKESNISLGFRELNELCFIHEAFFLSGTYNLETSRANGQAFSRFYFKSPHPSILQCKEQFQSLVLPLGSTIFEHSKTESSSCKPSSSRKSNKRPDLLNIPSFHTLHLLIRTFGARRDSTGLRSLLQWMQAYASDLDQGASEVSNGPRLRRLAIVAMRVYLERTWERDLFVNAACRDFGTQHPIPPGISKGSRGWKILKSADCDIVSKSDAPKTNNMTSVVGIVESVRSWGGWPSDKEVQRYLAKQRRFDNLREKYANEQTRY